VVTAWLHLVLHHYFSLDGCDEWDLRGRPLIRAGTPLLIDDDLRFEDGHGPRAATVMNRWLRELPISGAPSPRTWRTYDAVADFYEIGWTDSHADSVSAALFNRSLAEHRPSETRNESDARKPRATAHRSHRDKRSVDVSHAGLTGVADADLSEDRRLGHEQVIRRAIGLCHGTEPVR